jgi:hypothetical protein
MDLNYAVMTTAGWNPTVGRGFSGDSSAVTTMANIQERKNERFVTSFPVSAS